MPNLLLDGLFGKQQAGVLAVLFTRPEEWLYQRQIAQLSGLRLQQVQRALIQLVRLGVARREHRGGRVYYSLNPRFPLLDELRGIVIKTAGITGVLANALRDISGITYACVFGSVAKGTADARSDVDLLVVGEVDFGALTEALEGARQQLGREISPIVYTEDEFTVQVRAGNTFLIRILAEPMLMITGEHDDLARVG